MQTSVEHMKMICKERKMSDTDDTSLPTTVVMMDSCMLTSSWRYMLVFCSINWKARIARRFWWRFADTMT